MFSSFSEIHNNFHMICFLKIPVTWSYTSKIFKVFVSKYSTKELNNLNLLWVYLSESPEQGLRLEQEDCWAFADG